MKWFSGSWCIGLCPRFSFGAGGEGVYIAEKVPLPGTLLSTGAAPRASESVGGVERSGAPAASRLKSRRVRVRVASVS